MKIKLPAKVERIIEVLNSHGFEAYAVGGCVRDAILGRIPDDWDITTSALPEQVKALFARTIDTGIMHGTVTVMLDKDGFEVTTYRIDGEYLDGRHPREVVFTPSLLEDLKRRDFTINAMAYSQKLGFVDLFGGMQDLQKKKICCVGDARERFGEDALRILRAVRFAAQLNFKIEEDTKQAIRELAFTLTKISAERIRTELVKLLNSNYPQKIKDLYTLGISKEILPLLDEAMETPMPKVGGFVGEYIVSCLEKSPNIEEVRWAILLSFFSQIQEKTLSKEFESGREDMGGSKLSKEILQGLRFDNYRINRIKSLVLWHDLALPKGAKETRRYMSFMGEEMFFFFLELKRAFFIALGREENKVQEEIFMVKAMGEEIIDKKVCVSLKGLAVDGSLLIKEGIEPGKKIGEILSKLLDMVLENPTLNERKILLDIVKKNYGNEK
ncbi:MAG TPA: CCA tRNA nucleotidyltransferase, partial [Lachnospiraceae bacterium]